MLAGTERENGAISSFRTGNPIQQVMGKAITYFAIYLVHAVYLFGILFRLYKFPMKGEPFELFLFLTPFLFSAIFLALAISSLFKNREISMIVLLCTSIPALFLTGFSWPKEAMPEFLQWISWVIPSTAGIDGFLKLNQMGASLFDVHNDWLILSILCIVYFVLAVLSQSKQMKTA